MSCLFDSISFFTKNCSSQQMREMVTEYLQSDPPYLDSMKFSEVFSMFSKEDVHFTSNITEYSHRMKSSQTWGGAIEIQAICNLFNISIQVHVLHNPSSSQKPIVFIPSSPVLPSSIDPEEPLHILSITWNGGHFEPVRS